MSRFASLRRLRFPILLFGLCLSAVLLFPSKATSTQAIISQSVQQAIQPQPKVTKTDVNQPSLTKDVGKIVLENGLTVLTKEVHTAPVVSVQVWYRIGSINEDPGVNGIAHQLEHMLFKGTKTRPIQFGRLLSALGSDSNAFTSYDKTAYFGTVERNKLTALLTLEADRMQNSLINAEQLASEKRVVISELQGYENSPSYRLSKVVMRAAFPDRPYGLPVGGTKADVEKFTVEQVQHYYQNYYSPSNATLVIVGDFQTEPTLKAVKEIFSKVPNESNRENLETERAESESKIQNPKSKIVLREAGSAAMLQAVYPLPAIAHPDVPTLDVMDYVLTEGRSSRLYQALVESGIASDIDGGAINLITGGWYELAVTAAPGKDLGKIDSVLSSAIANLQNKGITTEELNRAKTQLHAALILQNRDISNQAMQLGNDQTVVGDYQFTDRYLAAVERVSAADVQRVAQKYLSAEMRTVGFFEPTQIDGKAGSTATGVTQTSESFNSGPPVDPAEVAKYLPSVGSEQVTPTNKVLPQQFTLPNNLKVLLLPDRSTPTVTLTGFIQAGTAFDSKNTAGLANLTAENLMNGTRNQDVLTIAKTLEDRGANLSFNANREGVIFSGNALRNDLPTLIDVLADVVQNATFPNNELELSRQRALTTLKVDLDNPSTLARRKFQQAIYPKNHPLHLFPTEETLSAITRNDLVEFYQNHYRPDGTVLVLVGDFEPTQVRSLLSKSFASWNSTGKTPTLDFPSVELPSKVVQFNSVIPGKSQTVTLIGYKGIDRKDPRYYAALVLNQILGGDTLSSRLGTEIRDRQGLTYGIYSYFQAGKYAGPFLISMQTAPEDTQKAIASTLSLLRQLYSQGVTDAEVRAAQLAIASSYTVSLADPDSLASRILLNEVYGLTPEELREFSSKIQALTPDQVNQAIKELLHPDNVVVVTAGPGISASR